MGQAVAVLDVGATDIYRMPVCFGEHLVMPDIFLDWYTMTSFPVSLLCKGNEIGTATGFFYSAKGETAFVTNWHVLSGRNTYTGQPIRKDAATPDEIGMHLHHPSQLGKWYWRKVPLYDAGENALWLQHKSGQNIDVALVKCSNAEPYALPAANETSDMLFAVSMDAYILGFPKGITHSVVLPIWKRASIATEPQVPYEELPVFLVDSATREGMSGSPVFLRQFGSYISTNMDFLGGAAAYTRFVGIYSGRFGADDELGAQLGRVWHRSVIDEILSAGVPGAYKLKSKPQPQ